MPFERERHILVVEDEEDFGETLRRVLVREGYRVGLAKNGKEALKALGEERYDLIITDLVMPEMGGMGFLKEVRARRFSLPVIMITAYGDWTSYAEALALRASDFLSKPLAMADLLLAVKKVFDREEPLC
ncbi:MAG: response regulator [candidate division NC10 bacterium]|nr:response regulator [candidate division NC10 bacterium]